MAENNIESPALTLSTYTPITTYTSLGQAYEDAFDNVPGQLRVVDWAIGYLLSQHRSPPIKGEASTSTSTSEGEGEGEGEGEEKTKRKIHVVDLGCGTGRPVCARLAAAAAAKTDVFDVLGIDLTPTMVEVARERVSSVFSNTRFEVGDIRIWNPYSNNAIASFHGDGDEDGIDGVFTFFSLLAGVTQQDIRQFFHRAIRWVRPGGILVFGTVPVDTEGERIRFLGQDMVVSSLDGKECVREIEKAGWRIEGLERENYRHKGVEMGLCTLEEAEPEEHLFIWCTKPLR